jgi:hypothetical protein
VVPSSDLSSIQGLEDKHLRVLARHGVTDLRDLVQADRGAIHRGMANLRPRPSLNQIARWQEDARDMLAETAPGAAEWQTAASFVVVFSQRQAGDIWERRVEAERTEVEPERNPQVWRGWEAPPICDWMLGQLGQANSAAPAPAGASAGAATGSAQGRPGAAEPPPAEPAAERPALRIDSAVFIDAAGRTDVVTAGVVAAVPPGVLAAPVRVEFTISGARPKARLRAVARILRPDGPSRNAQEPVAVPGSGRVELNLSGVAAGEHDVGLTAWAPDGTAKPVSVRLPKVTIRCG